MLMVFSAALAGMVGGVVPGRPVVGLLLCAADSPCVEEARWMQENVAAAQAVPVMFFVEALADTGDAYARAVEDKSAFDNAIAAARAAWAAGHVEEAAHQLDLADAAMRRATLDLSQQSLFDLYFLRGAVAIMREDTSAAASLARAAAVAWNRSIELPASTGPVATAYRDAQHRVMHMKPGTLSLSALDAPARWTLNGVEIGSGPATLTVLTGTHRVVASLPGKARSSPFLVEVQPQETVPLAATFPAALSVDALADAVRARFDGTALDPAVVDALRSWSQTRGISSLHLYYVHDGTHQRCEVSTESGHVRC